MLTAVIVEDNIDEAELLKIPLLEMQPDAEIIVFQSGDKAFEFIKDGTKKTDIFFLDRELLGMNGFEIAERIRAQNRYSVTPIVFVTGHDMDKLYAYEQYSCYHYLLKSFSDELVKNKISNLLESLSKNKPAPLNKVICLNTRKGEFLILTNDIFFIEKKLRGCLVYTASTIYDVPQVGLEELIDEINEKYFVRCHKSFAVNLKNIINISSNRRDIWVVGFKNVLECEIVKYINGLMEKRETESKLVYVGDAAISGFLLEKKREALDKGIILDTLISKPLPFFPCSRYELIEILDNLLSNSFEAVEHLKNKDVFMEIAKTEEHTFIKVINGLGNSVNIKWPRYVQNVFSAIGVILLIPYIIIG